MIIYKATNLINGKMYVGKTEHALIKRKDRHLRDVNKGSQVLFHKAIRKYGAENFSWETIDSGLFVQLESYWIKQLNSKAPHGYNLTDGGEGCCGCFPNSETRNKMSSWQIGKTLSLETRKKISIANTGRILSEEHKKKCASNRGKRFSIETRTKMSLSRKKFIAENAEYREAMSNRMVGNKYGLGKKRSPEIRKKMSELQKGNKNWLGKHHGPEYFKKIAALWDSPAYRAKRSAIMKDALARPEIKSKLSSASKTVWSSPEYRAKHALIMNSQKVKAKFKEKMKGVWNSPEWRANQSAKTKAYYARRRAAKEIGAIYG